MPLKPLSVTAFIIGGAFIATPAVAQQTDNFQLDSFTSPGWPQSPGSSSGIGNDEILRILSAQSGTNNAVESVLNGNSASGSIPQGVWNVMQGQTSNIGGYGDLFGSLGRGSSPGSVPQEVWDVMRSQTSDLGGYGDLASSVEGLFSNNSPISDLGSGIVFDDWGGGFVEGGLSGNSSIPSGETGGRIPDIGDLIPGSQGEIPGLGDIAPEPSSGFSGIFSNFKFPDLSRFNPFKRTMEFLKKTPLATLFGSASKDIRGEMENNSLGIFTQNPVVKKRDQANSIDQEVARMMAGQRLGEEGAEWLTGEAQEATATLNIGLQSAATAIQTGTAAQELTSTQDVAKAVALQGGQNAAVSASLLQAQMQNQAALLQLQQLSASSIQLAADNSEGIDELNRRERVTRTRALHESAEGFVYVPGLFEEDEEK